jgi:hypothetical protein
MRRLFSRDLGFQPSHPLAQRRVARNGVGDYVGSAILIAGLQKTNLVLGRKRPNLRQQRLIGRAVTPGKQMYGNGPPGGNFAGRKRMIGLPGGAGNPPGDLEPLIETHGFPYTAMDLAGPTGLREAAMATNFPCLTAPDMIQYRCREIARLNCGAKKMARPIGL